MKIIIDAMGGDNAPLAPVEGGLRAAKELGVEVLFTGREAELRAALGKLGHPEVPQGVEIHAAQSGVVTLSQYNASYGNYCIISHGNGYATLYAHQKQVPIVQEGQTVQKGQVIGYVGTTGRSTGNHLHFELRVNGVRNDVLRLYPGMTFTSPSGGKMSGG